MPPQIVFTKISFFLQSSSSQLCFHCALRFQNPLTRKHAELLGPCFKTGRIGSDFRRLQPQNKSRDPSAPCSPKNRLQKARERQIIYAEVHQQELLAESSITLVPTQSASPVAVSGSFHPLFKVLVNFPSRYLFTIGLPPVFSLR